MKKIAFLFLSLLLVACSSDDDNESTSGNIVGVWEYTSADIDVKAKDIESKTGVVEFLKEYNKEKGILEFTDDMKYGFYDTVDKRWFWGVYKVENGKYYTSIDNNNEWSLISFEVTKSALSITSDETSWMQYKYPSGEVEKAISTVRYIRSK